MSSPTSDPSLMQINLGCGTKIFAGWVNVDLYESGADIQEDIRTVQFARNSAVLVAMHHVIEHFDRHEGLMICRNALEWLVPGGVLDIDCPSYEKCMHQLKKGSQIRFKKDKTTRSIGGAGLMGGRSTETVSSFEYHRWIRKHRALIYHEVKKFRHVRRLKMPPEFWSDGENHLYIWSAKELKKELLSMGYRTVLIQNPRWHGKRRNRDFRIEAYK